jgi:PAS domain S-box-containing protein
MSTPSRLEWPKPAAVLSYGGAIVAVATALLIGFVSERYLGVAPQVSVLLCAIMFVGWVSGMGAAVFATALAIAAFAFFLLEPFYSFAVEVRNIPRLLFFAVTAIFVVVLGAAQKRASDKAGQAERELKAIVDTMPALVARYSADGATDFVNQTWRDYTGLAREDWTGRGSAVTHPDDRQRVEQAWLAHLATGEPFEIEQRVRRADGEYRWNFIRRVPLRDDSENVIAWYGAGYDIEDRKRSEDALRRSETQLAEARAELQLTIDTIPALVATYQPDGLRSFANRIWLSYFGLSLQDVIGKGPAGVVHPDDAESVAERWNGALASGEPLQLEMRLRRADGEHRWHAVHRVPARGNAGEVNKWYSIAVDIEDRKRAEDALRRSESRLAKAERELQLTIDTIAAIVTCYRSDGERDFVNQTWRDYTGLAVEDIQGERWRTVVHPDDRAESAARWNASLATGKPFYFEQRLRRADGDFRWHMVSRIPLRADNGDVIRWYGIGFDIEDQKRAEEALRRSEAQLAEAKRELQATIDTIPTLVSSYRDDKRDFVNAAWKRFTGLSEEQALGTDWSITVHPDDISIGEARWREAQAKGRAMQVEQRFRRADGAYRWHIVDRVPLHNDKGEVVKWYATGYDIEDQKRAESALRQSEAKLAKAERELQLMIDNVPALITVFGPDGEREFVNKTWRDYTGHQLSDIQHGHWRTVVHPDDHEMSERVWRHAVATGESLELEHRVRRADGEFRWHMGRRVPLRDESGNIIRWYGVGTDIEDQKRAQSALRQSETRLAQAQHELQLTIDSIPTLVASYSPDGKRDFVNQVWRDYTGLSRDDAKGRSWSIIAHPDDTEESDREWRACLTTGKPFHMPHRLRRFDGAYRWHMVNRVPLRDGNGNIVKWYAAGFDIEDQKRAESALLRSEAYLAEAQKLSLTGSFGWVIASGQIFWSDETYKIMGYDRTIRPTMDLAIQRTLPEDRALVQQAIQRVQQGAQNLDIEHRLAMPDGQVRRVHVRAHRVRYVSGQEELVGAVMDITEVKKAQEALQAAQADLAHASRVATLGEISASIAHEVNQPLAAIIANGQACLRFLNRESPDLNDVRGTVEWMVKDGNRASDVIRRVRSLLNKADAQMAPLAVNDVIHEVVALLQRELAAQHVLLRLDLAAALPVIVADRVQLQQVIINLVMNGIEAMQATTGRRELLVRSRVDDAHRVVVAVEDRGTGITEEDADRLFHAFFSTKPSGLGLGLSICRSIIEVHGGRISASANIGPGATFQFALPSQREIAS